MKKRYLSIAIASLFSIVLVSCGSSNTNQPDSNDGWFEDEETENDSNIELRKDNHPNYTYDPVDNSNGSVSYEIFVRSFCDSNQDGVGDFNGITSKLDYLQTLGVSNLWLMPIHPSPSYHGYDVKDYYAVNNAYGSMADFENLVSKAKEHGITIMIDMVLNHSSRENPWFNQSYWDFKNNNNSSDSKKDYYVWSNHYQNGYNRYNDLYYESRFDGSMPDLNTRSHKVRNEIDHILKFWIDKGVKGFRLDAVKYFEYENTTYNVEFLTFLKETASKYDPNIQFVGECWDNMHVIKDYYQSQCDSFFMFPMSFVSNNQEGFNQVVRNSYPAINMADDIEKAEASIKEHNPNAYASYFLTNHDNDRAAEFIREEESYMAAQAYLLMPGTPYIYYGEEIALKGKRGNEPTDALRRLPMIWSSNDDTGKCKFPDWNNMGLQNYPQVTQGVNDQLETNYSLLNHYRKVINVRNKYTFLKHAVFKNLYVNLHTDNFNVMAYSLTTGNQTITIVHNFNEYNIEVDNPIKNQTIKDSISHDRYIPEINKQKLRIGARSSVVLG